MTPSSPVYHPLAANYQKPIHSLLLYALTHSAIFIRLDDSRQRWWRLIKDGQEWEKTERRMLYLGSNKADLISECHKPIFSRVLISRLWSTCTPVGDSTTDRRGALFPVDAILFVFCVAGNRWSREKGTTTVIRTATRCTATSQHHHHRMYAVAEQEATSKSEWYPFISAAIHHRRKLNGSYRQIVVEQQIIQMPPCHTQTDDYSPSVLLHKVFSRASGSTHLSSDRIPNTRTNDRSCNGNVKQSRWVGTSVLT